MTRDEYLACGIAMPAHVKPSGSRGQRAQTGTKPKRQSPERTAQRAVVCYLRQVLPSMAVVAAVKNEGHGWGKSEKQRMRFQQQRKLDGLVSGFPDLIVLLPDARTLLIEMKSDKGDTSAAQDDLHPRIATLGHHVAVCRSIDDARAFLARVGVQTMEHGT